MSLSINWQQGMAANSPFAIDAANQIGKLNTKAVSLIDSSNLRTNGLDSVSTTASISMDDFLSTIRDNLLSLNMQDNNGQAKDVAPLVQAFKSTINQLEEAFGKSVADMARSAIAQGIESEGASDDNMTAVLSDVFNKIALDSTLKGKNIELTKEMTGRTPTEDDEWFSQGLTRMLNAGGLTKALSNFYLTEQNDSLTTKKFTLNWSERHKAYGVRLVTDNYYNAGIKDDREDNTGRPEALRTLNYPPEAYVDGRMHGDLKSEWHVATKLAFLMAQSGPAPERGNLMDTIEGIINGSIEYEKSDNILQAVDLYSRFVEDKNGALAAINEFRGNHKEAFGRQISLGNLTESELAEYNTLNEKWSDIHQGYNQKSNELYVKILAEMKQ